jgi:hypothetical protein
MGLPDAAKGNRHYLSNRPPLRPSPLIKLPIGSITPKGWLRTQLELLADGLTGRLPELSVYCREDSGWLTGKPSHHGPWGRGWEEAPYWLKGFGDLGYVLKDSRIIAETRKWLEAILASQQADGYFGPPENKEDDDYWPNMAVLFALQSFHEATGDARVPSFLGRYFEYQRGLPPERVLGTKPAHAHDWQKIRAGDNLESIYWLYNRTGEPWLLELASALFARAADWTRGLPTAHVVNISQGLRQPGVYYQQSREPKHLEAVERNYRAVMEEYGQQPGGMFCADENFRPGHTDPRYAAETCGMVELMYSDESLLKITGDPKYADRCENIAFNSLPASMSPDLRALHYLTAPNLVQCDAGPSHCFQNQGQMISFDPWSYRCCQHNVGQGWPYLAEHLWMATPGDGLAAVLYAPCEVTAKVADDAEVTIVEDTGYPFREEINLTLKCSKPVAFPLALRVPGWCQEAAVAVNGEPQKLAAKPGSFVTLERTWSDGDRVALHLPMKIALSIWEKIANSVSVNRGPLSYSLKIGENWSRYGGTDRWPAFEVFPTTPWNYGLLVDRGNPEASFRVVIRPTVPAQPFTPDNAPVELRGRGKRIPNWTVVNNCAGRLQPSPVRCAEPTEEITLIPMGCARLRVSSFPTIGEGPEAHDWSEEKL